MTDVALHPQDTTATSNPVLALLRRTTGFVREWHRRYRSRAELASYSWHERADLGFAAPLDAEIAKPFWRK